MKTYGYPKSKLTDEEKELREYTCPWCGNQFRQYVRTANGRGKHSDVSTQVQCKECGNYLKTWQ